MSLSLAGIIITDSLIFSSSTAAQKELEIKGDNTITIRFDTPQKYEIIKELKEIEGVTNVQAEKKIYMEVGSNPFSTRINLVVGIEQGIGSIFFVNNKNNEVIINKFHDDINYKYLYLNGIPYEIVGKTKKQKTDFLDSLGISSGTKNVALYIPIGVAFRHSLDNKIDAASLFFDSKVKQGKIDLVTKLIINKGIKNFTTYSYIDAKRIVDNVLDRFSLLTNTIYCLLSITAIIITTAMCKRNFQYRSTEFAIKIIHGISPKQISKITLIESLLITSSTVLVSSLLSSLALYLLSSLLKVDVMIRFNILSISIIFISFSALIANIYMGWLLYKKNPLLLIKDRYK